jgi:hypothetical protein
MGWHFDVLCEVGEGALEDAHFDRRFRSREFGEALHESQRYLDPWSRYPKPLRRGATAGQVLRRLAQKGLVVRCGRTGWWVRSDRAHPAPAVGSPPAVI